MGWFARARSTAGKPGGTIPVLPQVGAPFISTDANVFEVQGTTAITGFSTNTPILPGRTILLYGTDGTGPAISDTALVNTANGTIHTVGSITLGSGKSLMFMQRANGSWWQVPTATAVG